VAFIGNLYYTGKTVILDHGQGLFTSYCHLSKIKVNAGDVVKKGKVVGLAGSTGRSTGPHLHWSAKLHGARVNPLDLVRLTRAIQGRANKAKVAQNHETNQKQLSTKTKL
jgi:murein DD-endopeptidase MepM/ murein hydrolase activator NlpD